MEVIGESLLGSYVRRHRGMEALGELRHHIGADDYDTWAKIRHNKSTTAVINLQGGQI
jgi:hypothetical protein